MTGLSLAKFKRWLFPLSFFRTNHLLESVCEATHPPVFYGALWECMASNDSIRLPALSFVLQHLDRRQAMAEQRHMLGNDGEVMVQAVCLAIQVTQARTTCLETLVNRISTPNKFEVEASFSISITQ